MRKIHLISAAVATALAVGPLAGDAQALSTRTFSFSSGSSSASAVFDITSGNLKITLTNTGSDVLLPIHVLTGIFFDLQAGNDPLLTRVGASLGTGSSVIFAPAAPVSGTQPTSGVGPNGLGGEWSYTTLTGGFSTYGLQSGISSAGLGEFGPADRFRTDSNLQGADNPNGLQYGITSGADNPGTGNAPVTGDNALIKNSVVFEFSGLPVGYDLASMNAKVTFQYGTNYSEPHFDTPNPMAGLMLGAGLASLLGLRRFRKGRRTAR